MKKILQEKKNKLKRELYLQRRKQAFINFGKGNALEKIFLRMEGGIKPVNSIKTAFTHRFPDNIKNGISRELKSGYIKHTKMFEKQIRKDINILSQELSIDINRIEWHLFEGIDESALKFIQEIAKENNVLDKVKIVLYGKKP